MFPTEADLNFYEALREPAWVARMRVLRARRHWEPNTQQARMAMLVDAVVNAHGRIRVTSGECASHNLMALAKSFRAHDIKELAAYLESFAREPACAISPKRRAGFAAKWARRLRERA